MSLRRALVTILVFAAVSAFPAARALALTAAPGDTASTVTLFANFDQDVVGAPPDVTLPGPPAGDHLTLNQAAGTVLVNASIDGLTMAAQLKQGNAPGGVSLFAWPATPPEGTEKVTVGWRAVAQDDNPITFVACTLRGSNGNVIASVEYQPHNVLTWDALVGPGSTLPVTYRQNRNNQFTLTVDLLAKTVSLAVDGADVPGYQNVPFAQDASDVARLGIEEGGTSPQTMAVDDIWAVAFSRVPDHAPVVTAPASASGYEAAPLSIGVTASDPDGDAITSLTASGTAVIAGATFAAGPGNTSGTLTWTPTYAQAGSYAATFTAANALSGSATTSITVGNVDRPPTVTATSSVSGAEGAPITFGVAASDPDGDAIASLAASGSAIDAGATFTPAAGNLAGVFAWTPTYAQAGSYGVTFTASNALSGSASTSVTVTNVDLPPAVTAPASQTGAEGALLTFGVTASDPDGDAISSLTAAGTAIAAGGTFTAAPGNTAGTFSWTPTFAQAGAYAVTFTAANALSGSATTAISIGNTDRPPVVTAPASFAAEEKGHATFSVSAADPDGDALTALTGDLASLPAGNTATFTADAGFATGTFDWTPPLGAVGVYDLFFHATANGLTGTGKTTLYVAAFGTSVTGRFIWTPQPGDEGIWVVTFIASNVLGETTTLDVPLTIVSGASASTPPGGLRTSTVRSDAALAPGAVQKGPIISATGSTNGSTGSELTLTATATSSGTALAGRFTLRRAGTATSATEATADLITLTADLTGLPAGNNAVFIQDQDPIVSAPALKNGDAGVPLSVNVGASDPDGDPIETFTADWTALPAGNDGAFTTNADHSLGTFTWTPALGDSGDWVVTFEATNRLVGDASTTIHVRGAAPLRVFQQGNRKINLNAARANECFQIEPIEASFDLTDLDLSTVVMVSEGTGSVSQIHAISTKDAVIGDVDGNQVPDLTICFMKDDLRQLFSLLRGQNVVTIAIEGSLITGGKVYGTGTLSLNAGSGKLAAAIYPNPLNPRATLRFTTTKPGPVRVRIFDVHGRMVRDVLDQPEMPAGTHEVTIDGDGRGGAPLSSGIYFYRIDAREGSSMGRLAVVK
ncbi:MAG: Ig-like domain-containing protein [Hyphomicrobiales bacterium]